MDSRFLIINLINLLMINIYLFIWACNGWHVNKYNEMLHNCFEIQPPNWQCLYCLSKYKGGLIDLKLS